MDTLDHVTDAYVTSLLKALAAGPLGAELLGLASGERQIVVKENPDGAGWVLRTEPVPSAPS